MKMWNNITENSLITFKMLLCSSLKVAKKNTQYFRHLKYALQIQILCKCTF